MFVGGRLIKWGQTKTRSERTLKYR